MSAKVCNGPGYVTRQHMWKNAGGDNTDPKCMTVTDTGGSEEWRCASLDILAGELMCNSPHAIAGQHCSIASA